MPSIHRLVHLLPSSEKPLVLAHGDLCRDPHNARAQRRRLWNCQFPVVYLHHTLSPQDSWFCGRGDRENTTARSNG